jgi:hypothetical protein
MSPRLTSLAVTALIAITACGGDEADTDPAVAPGAPQGAGSTAAQSDSDSVAQQDPAHDLVRETFAFRGSGRDPFLSLLKSGSVRPLIGDLRVTTINYDPRYPAQSVVVLRDTTVGKQYALKINDEVGRIRVTEIRADEVVLTLDELGVERQVVLSIRRRQEVR